MRRTLLIAVVCGALISLAAGGTFSAGKPILVTSIGQSAESAMVKQLCIMGKIPYEMDSLAVAKDLVGPDGQPKYSALVPVVGGSAKGLGAAGINQEQETARSIALLERAASLKINIVYMHIGGEERRGTLSDAFIRATLPYASSVIVVASGDKDSFFESVLKAAGRDVPITKADRIADTLTPLKRALGM
ncbi:MAG: DUF6305 family protein [Firmicutes bacterium]|jgi:hypothetical protein|nr:DUF6305 family protein [Bacillota bacterium]